MTKTYPSKVSYGLLAFIIVVSFGPLVPLLWQGRFDRSAILALVIVTIVVALVLHLFLSTNYTISGNTLKVKSGFIPFRPINILEIKKISKTKSLISSPAPSFDRILITHGEYGNIIISPKNKVAFINGLQKINPKIHVDIPK